MTANLPAERGGAVPAPSPVASRGAQTEAALSRLSELERPFRLAEEIFGRMERKPPPGIAPNVWRQMSASRIDIRPPAPGNPLGLLAAKDWLENVDADWLEASGQSISEALAAPHDRRTTRLTVGLMLSAFPSAREVREEFMATLLHELAADGFSPSIIAETARLIRRKQTFLPAIGEVLATCEEAKAKLTRAADFATEALAMTYASRAAAAAFDDAPNGWTAEMWSQAVGAFAHDRWATVEEVPRSLASWPDCLGPRPNEPGCQAPRGVLESWGYTQAEAA